MRTTNQNGAGTSDEHEQEPGVGPQKGGGPERRRQPAHQLSDFLFPQQMGGLDEHWAPHFIDYLYVAFTGSTAFSPTDTMPLSHRAKFLMMVEAILAMLLLSFIVSRAINII